MANLGSVTALIADVNAKVTTNGNNENTGVRVNELFRNILDTLTASPVVGGSGPAAVFASAAQGGLADSAIQPGANVSELVNDAGYLTTVPPPVPSPVLTGNMAYVDAVNGDDGTGEVGDITLPYLTLLAAQTAAPSGTTIIVYPGAYTSAALGKDGVNWYFMPGANVAFSSGNGFVASTAMTFKVRGYGNFNCTLGSARFVWTDNAGANIDIECDSITANVIRFSNGTARIKANSINILLNILAFGGDSVVIGDISSSTASKLLDHTGGTIVIRDSVMTNTTAAAPCIIINFGSGVELENVTLNSAGPAVTTLSTASVLCRGCFTSQALGAGVTAIGDIQYDYTTAPTAGDVATVNADGTWSWA